jgi:hypothetical protein
MRKFLKLKSVQDIEERLVGRLGKIFLGLSCTGFGVKRRRLL